VITTLVIIVCVAALYPDILFITWINENLAVFQAIGSLAVAGSAIAAFLIYRSNLSRHIAEDSRKASREFLEASISVLERIYEVFTDNGAHESPPRNDRLLWLSTARMVLRFQELRSRITVDEHDNILTEHEEYWRFRFYKILDENKTNFTKRYFSGSGDNSGGHNIAFNSIAVIFSFAKWREGAEDPLKRVNDKLLFARGVLPISQYGALEYLKDFGCYWASVEKLRDKMNYDS
jgi:hypothetical protein